MCENEQHWICAQIQAITILSQQKMSAGILIVICYNGG